MHPYLQLALATGFWRWLHHLGGLGLILLGLADNSVVPLPGSMDVLTVWLAAHERSWWTYYAAMATAGSLIGGYITYSLARKGGKSALERKRSKHRAAKIYQSFERWGFRAVAVPALLPPPFPIVPFLLAAGAMQYSQKKFLGALALGRGLRFTIVAALGVIYGNQIVRFFAHYYRPALWVLVALALIGGIVAFAGFLKGRQSEIADRHHAAGQDLA